MKQILTGDSTDNIQGIKGLGPKTAEKILDGQLYDRMLDVVIDTYKKKCGDNWEHSFCKSANLIYIRMDEQDFRPLSFEELKEKLSWKPTTDTGLLFPNDQATPLDSSTPSSDLQVVNT